MKDDDARTNDGANIPSEFRIPPRAIKKFVNGGAGDQTPNQRLLLRRSRRWHVTADPGRDDVQAGRSDCRDRGAGGAVNAHLAGRVSFAVLPGDNADDGSEAQFRMVLLC